MSYLEEKETKMAKITKFDDLLQEAEFPENLVPVFVRQGTYADKEGIQQPWVNLNCVDELVFTNASTLGIDLDELPTITVKVKNPDSRNWEAMVEKIISTTSATVVPVINNNQLKGLALSIDSSNI